MKTRLFALAVLALMVLAACQSAADEKLHIEDAWGRPSPMMAKAGAFYMHVHNPTDVADKLTGARSEACGIMEVHETKDDGTGMLVMSPVSSIDVPAQGDVELKPGGYHIMCIDKKDSFVVGAKLSVTVTFEKAGEITVEAEIKDE